MFFASVLLSLKLAFGKKTTEAYFLIFMELVIQVNTGELLSEYGEGSNGDTGHI